MKELEREALLADQEAVRNILANIPDSDPLGRLSFSSRLEDIERRLAELDSEPGTTGTVALMFGGGPVFGSRAIDTEFTSNALHAFQDLVAKMVASEEGGKLASRGRMPLHSDASLAITDIVRGSVGFVLRESAPNEQLADTAVKSAIDEVAHIIVAAGSETDEQYESAVESLDTRLLGSLAELFRTLEGAAASLRIVEGNLDTFLPLSAIRRGRYRLDTTEIKDDESDQVVGDLLGLLPGSKKFEMRLISTGETIRGAVAAAEAATYLSLIETPDQIPIGRRWRTKMQIREIRRNKQSRKLYTLIGLLEQVDIERPPAAQ